MKTLSKVDPNVYVSSSLKRHENGSVHTKTLSVFDVTENEAKEKRISVDEHTYANKHRPGQLKRNDIVVIYFLVYARPFSCLTARY